MCSIRRTCCRIQVANSGIPLFFIASTKACPSRPLTIIFTLSYFIAKVNDSFLVLLSNIVHLQHSNAFHILFSTFHLRMSIRSVLFSFSVWSYNLPLLCGYSLIHFAHKYTTCCGSGDWRLTSSIYTIWLLCSWWEQVTFCSKLLGSAMTPFLLWWWFFLLKLLPGIIFVEIWVSFFVFWCPPPNLMQHLSLSLL